MDQLAAARQCLERATELPAILSAAYDAFEDMLRVIEELQDPADGTFAALMMSGAAAASGRDAVAAAPSLPPTAPADWDRPALPPQSVKATTRDAAVELSELSRLLACRLADASAMVSSSSDQAGCALASRYAGDICSLLAGASRR